MYQSRKGENPRENRNNSGKPKQFKPGSERRDFDRGDRKFSDSPFSHHGPRRDRPKSMESGAKSHKEKDKPTISSRSSRILAFDPVDQSETSLSRPSVMKNQSRPYVKRTQSVYEKLCSLVLMEDRQLVVHLQKLIDDSLSEVTKSAENLNLFLEALKMICCCQHYKQNVVYILLQLMKSEFLNKLATFLSVAFYKDRSDVNWFSLLETLIFVIKNMFAVLPNNASETLGPTVNMTLTAIQLLSQRSNVSTEYDQLKEDLKQIESQRGEALANFRGVFSRDEILHARTPPDDFRRIPVTLCHADVHEKKNRFLRPNKVVGRYENVEHYLDVHFRLLREDFVSPLRDGILEFLDQIKNEDASKKKPLLSDIELTDIYLYTSVKIGEAKESMSRGILYELSFDVSNLRKVNWEASKRLMNGNLVCLSSDNFAHFGLAIVAERKPEDLTSGLITVQFLDPYLKSSKMTFLMIESPSYYESYAPVLQSLKRFNENTLAFQSNIVSALTTIQPPKYLNTEAIIIYDWSVGLKDLAWCPLDDASWPTPAELKMDESQHRALNAALCREIAIIQGPPGTGKTFIGLKIAEILMENNPGLQILTVCYTNHALDQFLEGILEFCPYGIIRVGGRSQSKKLEEFNLSNNRIFSEDCRKTFKHLMNKRLDKAFESVTYYKTLLNNCENRLVLAEWMLSELSVLSKTEFGQLQEAYFHKSGKDWTGSIEVWLDIEGYRCAAAVVEKQQRGQLKTITPKNDPINLAMMEEHPLAKDEMDKRIADSENLNLPMQQQQPQSIYFGQDEIIPEKANKHQWKKFEIVKAELRRNFAMSTEDRFNVYNIWNLSIKDRWCLYRNWLKNAKNKMIEKIEEYQDECERYGEMWTEFLQQEDSERLSRAKVIGMTTTGAAKYAKVLQKLQPPIVIIEEAAEVLEAHAIISLTSGCQHLILIGDQQQLRPNPTVYRLAKQFNLDVSLFERLINNGVPYEKLQVQHRMRPEIASLLVPHIYKDLQNHSSVEEYKDVDGMVSNVYFLDHKHEESQISDSRSRSNVFEAEMLVELCKYLLKQGYNSEQITILATYLGQVNLIRRLLRVNSIERADEVKCTAVDNYQGEENDIILLSLVRSNSEGKVGFLKIDNRVCVALSRAKLGLYCVGNFELLASQTKIWKPIVKTLLDGDKIGAAFKLVCQNHPQIITEVRAPTDFLILPNGGCHLPCDTRLECGHQCRLQCHIQDKEHNEINCQKPCSTVLCELNHVCPTKCTHECGPCEVVVNKTCPCGHENEMACKEDPNKFICEIVVRKTCPCGHENEMACKEDPNKFVCEVVVKKTCPCGHENEMACKKDPNKFINCEVVVTKTCPCDHENEMTCKDDPTEFICNVEVERSCKRGHANKMKCSDDPQNIKCRVDVIHDLKCGHKKTLKCHLPDPDKFNRLTLIGEKLSATQRRVLMELYSCKTKCIRKLTCGHEASMPCHQNMIDFKCKENCEHQLKCGHKKNLLCYQFAERTPTLFRYQFDRNSKDILDCEERCNKKLDCGHECTLKCGYKCGSQDCVVEVECEGKCGHKQKLPCNWRIVGGGKKCEMTCNKSLPCGHLCRGTCFKCNINGLHLKCKEKCCSILLCGHKCQENCGDPCLPCRADCKRSCNHQKCRLKCGQPCKPCQKPCRWTCRHKKCTKLCGEMCNREPCDKACFKILPCGHKCVCFCGEPCNKICPICDKKDFEDNCIGCGEFEDWMTFVSLVNCGHMIERKFMDAWMVVDEDVTKITEKRCPKCDAIIQSNLRYGNVIKQTQCNLNLVKKKIVESNTNLLVCLRRQVDAMRKDYCKQRSNDDDVNKKIQELIFQRNVDGSNLLFLMNKVEFLKNVRQLRNSSSIRLMTFNEISRFEKTLTKFINFHCVPQNIWYHLRRELARIEYNLKVNDLAYECYEPESRSLIKKIQQIINDSRMRFDDKKEDEVKLLLQQCNRKLAVRLRNGPTVEVVKVNVLAFESFKQDDWFSCKSGHVFSVNEAPGKSDDCLKCPRC